VLAAHPAGAFDESTARLLAETAQARVVCVNPRGIGGSSPPPGHASLGDAVADVETVRQRLALGPAVLWGMSGGGWRALLHAARHPQSVRALVVESVCACFRERLGDPTCMISPLHPAWRDELAARGLVDEHAHAHPSSGADTEWIDVEGAGAVFRRCGGPALLVAPMPLPPEIVRAMPELWTIDARPWLASIRVPTLVIAGTADPVVPVHRVRAVHEGIAGSRFLAIEGGGHVPTLERRPAIADAVRELLASLAT